MEGVPGVGYSYALMFGHEAVVVFIVVSGFSLMLAPLRSSDKSAGGTGRFLKRRAWRILPPYYAALLMWPLFLIVIRGLKYLVKGESDFADVLDMLGGGNLLSHLFLVHNLNPQWNMAINPPLWSIATEFQIYILFILLLLPIWKHLGAAFAVVIAFALGLAPLFLLPQQFNLSWSSPHLVGIFSLGMAAAVISWSTDARPRTLRDKLPWGPLALACGAVFIFLAFFVPTLRIRQQWLTDLLVGMMTAAGIVFCVTRPSIASQRQGLGKFVLGFLDSRPVNLLGRISYSLYLIQIPALLMMSVTLSLVGAPEALVDTELFGLFVQVPLVIAAAYLFYLAVEQWFLPGRFNFRFVRRAESVPPPVPGISEG